MAARVLSEIFQEVIILERDSEPHDLFRGKVYHMASISMRFFFPVRMVSKSCFLVLLRSLTQAELLKSIPPKTFLGFTMGFGNSAMLETTQPFFKHARI
ncbi:hypothetical protein M5V91_05565 [Cytobacillus pseudoceanisediminis]|uniref:hypothetical protein n=1 Tax=Cytobacillus pseudoceanisediminis TaxID=3051614 RepID=UPI002184BB61|nr:hypothetical protein [Cytobacillus pseudoceanisediminis]UQX56647.1 hypothetical protein M5V91_05565 [Cytobacillus pseudoceanisediminis]